MKCVSRRILAQSRISSLGWSVLAFVLMSGKANADRFIIHDNEEVPTVEHLGSNDVILGLFCDSGGLSGGPVERCVLDFANPNIIGPTLPTFDFLTTASFETNGSLSDWLGLTFQDFSNVTFIFYSDVDGFPLESVNLSPPPLVTAGTHLLTEDGSLQDAIHIQWNNGSQDTISYQSDAEVPEPSSFLLFAIGALVFPFKARSCVRVR